MVALELFWTFFVGTGVVMRAMVAPLHNREKTLTLHLRRKTNRDIHHIHFGFFFLAIAICVFIIRGVGFSGVALSAIGLSLIADEVFLIPKIKPKKKGIIPGILCFLSCIMIPKPGNNENLYFKKNAFILSVIAHIIIGVFASIIIVFYF